MRRRDAETIRDLVAMLREEREKAETAEMLRNDARYYAARAAKANRLQAELDDAKARIADLEARPAAPSVEQVADAIVWHRKTVGAPYYGVLCKLFHLSDDDASVEYAAAWNRYNAQVSDRDDAS